MLPTSCRSTVLIVLLVLGILPLVSSCDRSTPGPPPPRSYTVIDSVLGTEYDVAEVGISFQPPRGYEIAADTIMELLQRRFQEGRGLAGRARLVQCFLDTIHISGLLVTVLDSVGLDFDTTLFLAHYRTSVHGVFRGASVNEWNVPGEWIVRKNFLTADSLNFRYQVLCLLHSNSSLELNYFGPRMHYDALSAALESSAGTIRINPRATE